MTLEIIKLIKKISITSGGQIENKGSVIVNSIKYPNKVIGISDGKGGLINNVFDNETKNKYQQMVFLKLKANNENFWQNNRRKSEPFIIAEISGNHDGSFLKMKKLIDAAKWSGADAVKLQTFKPELIIDSKFE